MVRKETSPSPTIGICKFKTQSLQSNSNTEWGHLEGEIQSVLVLIEERPPTHGKLPADETIFVLQL